MLKQISKAKRRPIHLMSKEELSEYLVGFDQRTKCEDALNELKRAVSTLGVLRDAAENGECFDSKPAADALMFIIAGIEQEIEALERAIFMEPEGGANA